MAENNDNNKDGQDPRKKVVRVRFNFSWFYLLLIFAIGWMLFSQNGTPPAKIEWAQVPGRRGSRAFASFHLPRVRPLRCGEGVR